MSLYYKDFELQTSGHAGTQQDPWSYIDYIAALDNALLQNGDEVLIKGKRHEIVKSPFPLGKKIKWNQWGSNPWRLFIDTIDGNSFEGISLKNGIIKSIREDNSLVLGGELIDNISNLIVLHNSASQKIRIIRKSTFNMKGCQIYSDNDCQVEDYKSPKLEIVNSVIVANSIMNKQFYSVVFEAGEGGYISGDLNQFIEHGEETALVEAFPEVGQQFDTWSGDIESSQNPLVITNIIEDMNIIANFISI